MVTSERHRNKAKSSGLSSPRLTFKGSGLDHERLQNVRWETGLTIALVAMLLFNTAHLSSYYLTVRRVDHVDFVKGQGLKSWRFPSYPLWQEGAELFYLPIHHIDRSVIRPRYW